MLKLAKVFWFLLIAIILSGCGAPLFRLDTFAPAPEVIEQLEPYLERWATQEYSASKLEMDEVASEIEGVWWIGIMTVKTSTGELVDVVSIVLEEWGGWYRGYLYVHDGSELVEGSDLSLRRVDEHLYIFNMTE